MSVSHRSFFMTARPRAHVRVSSCRSGSSPAVLILGGRGLRGREPDGPAAAAEPVGAVDDDDLMKAGSNDANWLMYGRTYDAQRYSPLKQINAENVSRLIPAWTFQTGVLDGFECTPLVIDGIMYVTTPWNHAYAIDCKTGSQLWHYQKSLPENLALCCDAVNRGFAAWGDRLYMATLDAHLVCLDRNTGEEIWDAPITIPGEDGKEVGDIYKMAYSATVAPLVIKGKVIIGISGAEYGIRGFLDAYDAKNGKRLWRFYTVPSGDDKSEHAKKALATWEGNSWLTGGGSVWVTGTYDPALNTLYWGVGNPSPDFNGEVRKGDNLYTCSILALNPDDGSYKWHFQNSPHDVWDYDGVNEPVLVDINRGRQAGQGAGPGAPQRLFLLPEPGDRRIPLRQAVLRGQLDRPDEGGRRARPEDGPPVRQPGRPADRGGRPGLSRGRRRQGMEPDGLSTPRPGSPSCR